MGRGLLNYSYCDRDRHRGGIITLTELMSMLLDDAYGPSSRLVHTPYIIHTNTHRNSLSAVLTKGRNSCRMSGHLADIQVNVAIVLYIRVAEIVSYNFAKRRRSDFDSLCT